jgi:hypothetical protein
MFIGSVWGLSELGGYLQITKRYPLVNVYIAIENGPFIVDLPIENGDFP